MAGYFDTLRDEIEPLIPANPSIVMDIGCGEGVTSRWLKQIRPNITTVGVEIERSVAAKAALAVDHVLVVDLDKGMEPLASYSGQVDLLLLLDVLEHLHDPWARLLEIKSLLAPNGVVIASIPNVRNVKVLGPLLIKSKESGNIGVPAYWIARICVFSPAARSWSSLPTQGMKFKNSRLRGLCNPAESNRYPGESPISRI